MRQLLSAIVFVVIAVASHARAEVNVSSGAAPRVLYGASRLEAVLKSIPDAPRIDVRTDGIGKPEGYTLARVNDGPIGIHGNDASGALYGCIELANRIQQSHRLEVGPLSSDLPMMSIRGPCIGMQKTYILPGRKVYEYPYTPELFPFFYDKKFWTKYLDFLADNRFNTLYIWSGQPFASLVRVKDYPEAIEVSDDIFKQNTEMYRWIVTEADRRGVRVVQMFYSIILPKPLAEKNGISTQLKEPVPVAEDYTRKAISEFVVQYPNVGLMACLGEALQGQQNQNHWLDDVIIAGLKDGIARAGLKDEPPLIIRTHATDLRQALPDALKLYKNIDTEAKFNGESLTTYEPRGKRQIVHQAMSKLANVHIANVHILANLEPFRYGDTEFIRKSVIAMRDRLGAKGLHLYPLAYWSWPESPDMTATPLEQIDRDWIWFEAWGRYAWNPDRDPAEDHKYWIGRLTERYGDAQAAEKILAAYNDSGEVAPMLIRRFGITEGNRQTLSLGMTLDELVHPEKHGAFEELWESQSPPGERLDEYVDKEIKHQPHTGETPTTISDAAQTLSLNAVIAIDSVKLKVTRNHDEYERLRNDVHCIQLMADNYAGKVQAATHLLKFEKTQNKSELLFAQDYLAQSLVSFRLLTNRTEKTYRFANTMQTNQRKIPVTGGTKSNQPANYHWTQLLPIYEKEYVDFKRRVAAIQRGEPDPASTQPATPIVNAKWKPVGETFTLKVGEKVFGDSDVTIQSIAPELNGITAVRISSNDAVAGKYQPIEFVADEPIQVLIGYVKSDEKAWRKPPNLETDALAAEHGGIESVLDAALVLSNGLKVDIHVMNYPAGKGKLDVRGGEGAFLILGAIPQSAKLSH